MSVAVTDRPRGDAAKLTVHNPVGYPPKVTKKTLAPRLESLDGKTIYLVDSRFDDSVELLKQVVAWFDEKMPGVTTKLVSLSGYYGRDDPELWAEIKANGHAAILGVGHCSTCAPAVSTHAVTLETKYGIPTVAIHTSKFDRVVRSVTRIAGLPDA
ncbi:MAG: Thiol-disulfide oxidoreductase protein, partial [Sphingomonas bacterium]|nr:Thiol-disulfide oxidoreductase protein [Sphingomonas bacterium]